MKIVTLENTTPDGLIKACDTGRKSGQWYCIGAEIKDHKIEIKGFGRWLQIFRIHSKSPSGSPVFVQSQLEGYASVVHHGVSSEAASVKAFRELITNALAYHGIAN